MNKPVWYVTPQEFADLVVETMQEMGYFKSTDAAHPEDIWINFQTVGEGLSKGIGYAGSKIVDEERVKNLKAAVKSMRENISGSLDPEYPL